jgi:hypothetical protein
MEAEAGVGVVGFVTRALNLIVAGGLSDTSFYKSLLRLGIELAD